MKAYSMSRYVAFSCYFLWMNIATSSSSALHCHSPKSSSFKFTLLSSRNATGHWTTQLQLEHGADEKVQGPFEADIEQTTLKCGDRESIKIVATVIAPPSPSHCSRRHEYEHVPGIGHYKVHTIAKSWVEANKICMDEHAHLVVINSVAEKDAIRNIWGRYPKFTDTNFSNYIHVGLRKDETGTFVTYSGIQLKDTGYESWDANEPNNA